MLLTVLIASASLILLPACDNASNGSASSSDSKQTTDSSTKTTDTKTSDSKASDTNTTTTDPRSPDGLEIVDIVIAGKTFHLELAANDLTRAKGLMDRQSIPEDGGMLFVFPRSKLKVQSFWMKNCLTDMDIIYLDGSGGVLAHYEMKKLPLRGQDPAAGPDESENDYEQRIVSHASYSSRFPATFAIELAPGSVKTLGITEGDKIHFDTAALKAKAR